MIVAQPSILSDEWMLIGRQENTGFGGRVDLLAIAPDGSLILIELKRDRTPREVLAQALDYACWVENLRLEDILRIYGRFCQRNFIPDFQSRFGQPIADDTCNQNHQIIIVASALDDGTERIVNYLSKRDIPINVLFFQVFSHEPQQLISRTWLIDPVQTQVSAAAAPDIAKEPWNGEFYANFGEGKERSWAEAVNFGFISAGGGTWWTGTLKLLGSGDRVWVKAPGYGFVGVGRVLRRAEPMSSFRVQTPEGEKPVLEMLKNGSYHREFIEDTERCEYFVAVRWLQTVPINAAINEPGLFGNQHTVCRPTAQRWRATIDLLKKYFPGFNEDKPENY